MNRLIRATGKLSRASFLALVSVVGGVVSTIHPSSAEAGCKECFASGYTAADLCCNFAINAAFGVVNSAIVISEETLLEAMGMGVNQALGTVGFPGLQVTIEASEGQAAKTIVDSIEIMAKHLTLEQRRLPAAQQALRAERERGAAAVTFPDITGANALMGQALGAGGGSSTPAITQFLASTSGEIVYGDNKNSGDTETPAGLPTKAVAETALGRGLKNKARAHQAKLFQSVEAKAKENDKILYEELSAAILIDRENMTVKSPQDEADDLQSGELSTSDKLDIIVQLLTDSQPEDFQALEQTARSMSAVTAAAESKVRFMRQTVPASIYGRFTNMRRAHPGSLGGEVYLTEAMGEELDGPISDEEFLELLATRRVKDARLIALNSVSTRIAAQELAQMEAEHLYLKYQRYLAKRDTNIALAQILASQNRAESRRSGLTD